MKNPNGFGTVYKMSGKRRRPWRAVASINVDGTTQRITVGYYAEKTEALKALVSYDAAVALPKEELTLKSLYDEWSPDKYASISKQTADCYRAAWNYLAPLYKHKFRDLRTAQMQKIINTTYESKSKSTVKNIKILLSMMYDYANENDIISKNYAEFIKLPKEERKEKDSFNDVEIKLIAASKFEWADSILVLIYTGMRISEMLGLTKFNIDTKEWVIKGGVKTDAGKNRIIPIHPSIQPIIQKWLDRGGEYLLEYNGKQINTKYYREDLYRPTLEKIGVRQLNPHACRHTFATKMSKAGADTVSIQKIIGHSDYSTTANIYTHTDIKQLRKAIKKI